MKQKLLAVLAAFALCLNLAGCHVSTPASVGYIGDVEISAGIYLISQFQAYQTVLGYANTEQSEMSVSKFLKETVYVAEDGTVAPEPVEGEEQTGEARSVSDFVASETLANLEYYAAVESLFAELGGELTEDNIATAQSYADQLWEYYGDLYEANGIGESTLFAYQCTSVKNSLLLEMIYGADGTEAVSDADLTAFLDDEMIYGHYLSVPLYNTTDYTFADETQQEEIVAALDDIISVFSASMQADDTADAYSTFITALESGITAAYDVMGDTIDTSTISSSVVSDLYGYSTLAEYFDEDTLAQITSLGMNEAVSFTADYTSAMVFMRSDPIAAGYTIDDLRTTILYEMKSDIYIEKIEETGTALENSLDESAVSKFPTKKIVAE
ncbi:MAG: foldase [Faecalibacterium sp.]